MPLYENLFSNKDRNYSIGIVVLDFIQCINKVNILVISKILKDFGFLEAIKRLIHTILFNISLKKSDYFIVISDITKCNLKEWISQRKLPAKNNIFVIHPLPSFNENKILNYINEKNKYNADPILNRNSIIDFISISGTSPSKGSQILMPIFRQLADLNKNKTIRLKLFGVDILKDLKFNLPNNLIIKCYSSVVKDSDLIDAYVNSSIFISTSFEEGFGIPFLDALLFGCNCLCSSIGVYKEINLKYNKYNQNIYLVNKHKISVVGIPRTDGPISFKKQAPKNKILYFLIEENRGLPSYLLNIINRTNKLPTNIHKKIRKFSNETNYWKKMSEHTEKYLINFAPLWLALTKYCYNFFAKC